MPPTGRVLPHKFNSPDIAMSLLSGFSKESEISAIAVVTSKGFVFKSILISFSAICWV
jgi:hypothetical protein